MTDYRTAKGWLTINERELLAMRAREALHNVIASTPNARQPCAANVGIEYGASLHCIKVGFPGWVVAIDIDLSKVEGFNYQGRVVDGEERIYWLEEDSASRVERILRAGDYETSLSLAWPVSETAEGKPTGFWTGPIAFAFIDGDHGYNAVYADCRFAEYIPIGGVIAFHDCYSLDYGKPHLHPHSPDCNIAVSDWYAEQAGKWEEQESVDSIRWFRRVA